MRLALWGLWGIAYLGFLSYGFLAWHGWNYGNAFNAWGDARNAYLFGLAATAVGGLAVVTS